MEILNGSRVGRLIWHCFWAVHLVIPYSIEWVVYLFCDLYIRLLFESTWNATSFQSTKYNIYFTNSSYYSNIITDQQIKETGLSLKKNSIWLSPFEHI